MYDISGRTSTEGLTSGRLCGEYDSSHETPQPSSAEACEKSIQIQTLCGKMKISFYGLLWIFLLKNPSNYRKEYFQKICVTCMTRCEQQLTLLDDPINITNVSVSSTGVSINANCAELTSLLDG